MKFFSRRVAILLLLLATLFISGCFGSGGGRSYYSYGYFNNTESYFNYLDGGDGDGGGGGW